MKCDKCQNKAYCDEHVGIRRICKRNGYNGFVMYTNADRLRSMTDEELAIWLSAITWCEYCPIRERCDEVIQTRFCKDILLEWLKAEVSE